MSNKKILITGSTSGVGKATAMSLAKTGAELILVAKNEEKVKKLIDELTKHYALSTIHYFICDLTSQKDIHKLAYDFKSKYNRLDVLINNAGLIINSRCKTVNGYEYTFALDHLAYFLLTNLLLDVLKLSTPSRIINVSSEAHRMGKIDFDDLMGDKKYTPWKAYSQAKYANILFTYELAERLKGTGVTVNCLHPGVVDTNFGSDLKGGFNVIMKLGKPFMISAEKGAETSVYLATSTEVEGITGKYFNKKKAVKTAKGTYNKEDWKKLWELSEHLVQYKYPC